MKKFIVLTLITALSLFFGLNVLAVEDIAYDFTVYDNYAYDLETGEFYESYAYAVTNRITVQNHNIHVDAETFHHLLTFDKNNVFLGYYNTIYATIETSKYLGTFASLSNTLPDNVSKIAFMIYTSSNDKPEPELNNHSLREVFEESSIYSVGKNLFDGSYLANTAIDGSNGNILVDISGARTSNLIQILSSTSYTIKTDDRYTVRFLDVDLQFISFSFGLSNIYTFTTPSNAKYMQVFYSRNGTNVSAIQFEQGTVATTYAPYKSSLNNDLPPFVYWYNLDTLGIQTLTVSQMDYWYNTYIDNFATNDYVQLLDTGSFDLILPSFQRDVLPPSELDTDAEGFFEKMLSDAGFNDEFGQTIIAVVILVGLAVVMAINKLPSMVIISVVILAYIGLTFIGWLPAWVIIVFAIVLIVIAFLKLKGGNSNEDD